jgi:hypothetical protein
VISDEERSRFDEAFEKRQERDARPPEEQAPEEEPVRQPLGPSHTRPRYDKPTGIMIRVPPQLRGENGPLPGEEMQMLTQEQVDSLPELMRKQSQKDALRSGEGTLTPHTGPEQLDRPGMGGPQYRTAPKRVKRQRPAARSPNDRE